MKKIIWIIILILCCLTACWFAVSIFFMLFSNEHGHGELRGNDYDLFKETPAWELAKAIKDCDTYKMEELIIKNPTIIDYQEPKYGNTLLMMTIMNQQYKQFRLLLDNNADVNIHDFTTGSTALMMSIDFTLKKIKFAKALVSKGANVNDIQTGIHNDDGKTSLFGRETVLMAAIHSEKKEFVQFILENGADINFQNECGISALSTAMLIGNMEITYYLLQKGADYTSPLWYIPDLSKQADCKDKANKGEPRYLQDELKRNYYEFYTKQYKYKMKIVDFLLKKGINYWEIPVPEYTRERIQKEHPNNWQEILKKY